MAGKAIIPFNEVSSTFALEGEPSPVNLVLAALEVDQEAEHIAKTPLAIIHVPVSKEAARGAKGGSAEPPWRPLSLPFDAVHHQEDLRQEGQVPGLKRFCTSNNRDARTEGHVQAPLRRSASTDAARGGSGARVFTVYKEWGCR